MYRPARRIPWHGVMGMRRILSVWLVVLALFHVGAAARAQEESAQTAALEVKDAKAAALVDVASGRILWSLNGQEELPMASTTKIMTALVAIEHANLSDVVTASRNAHGVEGSSMYLDEGERQSVNNLLFGLMLRSGNDAAVALAEYVGGSVPGFAQLMNDTGQRLKLVHTRFVNPHGLPAEGHYTSGEDLARLAAYALRNEEFARVVGTKRMNVPWEGKPWDRAMSNKNKLLYDYEGATGVKTGYTKAAGRCLVASAERDGRELVAVVLNCGPMYERCAQMLDWGFANVTAQEIVAEGQPVRSVSVEGGSPAHINAVAARQAVVALLPGERPLLRAELPASIQAPVARGQVIGTLRIRLTGMDEMEVPLIAGETVASKSLGALIRRVLDQWFLPAAPLLP